MLAVYYVGIKAAFLYGLVHAFVKYEPLQKHWLFLGLLYTAGVVMLSWVWFVCLRKCPTITPGKFSGSRPRGWPFCISSFWSDLTRAGCSGR